MENVTINYGLLNFIPFEAFCLCTAKGVPSLIGILLDHVSLEGVSGWSDPTLKLQQVHDGACNIPCSIIVLGVR